MTTTTYFIGDGNASFSGLTAERVREVAASWWDCAWDPETDLGILERDGFDFSVSYEPDEEPARIARRACERVASALATLRADRGEGYHGDLFRDELAGCRVTVREESTDEE